MPTTTHSAPGGANETARAGTSVRGDVINHPPHYTHSSIEPIDAIEAWKLGFHLGNVVKYIARAAHKGSELNDLRKARWYLERAIARLERLEKPATCFAEISLDDIDRAEAG